MAKWTWRSEISEKRMRTFVTAALAALIGLINVPSHAADHVANAAANLNALGREGEMLAAQLGVWTVTETMWAKPGAAPVVSSGLIAERRLSGNLLEETLRSGTSPAILRRDFLTYNRVEGRWSYMSFDTRVAAGMMTAQSYGPEASGKIDLVFQPFALPGGGGAPGDAVAPGQLLRMRQEIIRLGPNHVVKNQYFTLADGRGVEWLAHRYDSTRR